MEHGSNTQIDADYFEGLDRDKVFAALTAQQKREQLEKFVRYGQVKAKKLLAQYASDGDVDVQVIAIAKGIRIVHVTTKQYLPYLAEYTARTRLIELYDARIREVGALLTAKHPEYFEKNSLAQICLAHELFHHLEREDNGATGRISYVQFRLLGLIPRKHYFAEGSEIAAHAFTQTLLGLPFSTYTFAKQIGEIYKDRTKIQGQAEIDGSRSQA